MKKRGGQTPMTTNLILFVSSLSKTKVLMMKKKFWRISKMIAIP